MKTFTNDLTRDEYGSYLGACRAANELATKHPGRVIHVLDADQVIRGRFLHAAKLDCVENALAGIPVSPRAPRKVRLGAAPKTRDEIDVAITAQPKTIVRRNPTNAELIERACARG